MGRISYIKERYSCVDYAHEHLGWPVYKSGDRTTSFAPNSENKTALVVFDEWWYDHKQKIGGDIIDLVALVKYNGNKASAIRELSAGYEGDDQYSSWVSYTQQLNNQIAFYHEALRPEDIEYLHKRGINDDTIKRLMIGYDKTTDRLVIPYFKNGYVVYYVSRDRSGAVDASKYKKAFLDGMNENIPWGLHTLGREGKYLVIAEGAFDAMSFEQEGYKVISPICGAFGKEHLQQVLSICRQSECVFICFDSDEAGCTFTQRMAEILFRNHINFVCGHVEGYKDVSEYYADGNSLQTLINNAVSGIQMLASKITDKDKFKEFVYECARYIDPPDLEEFFDSVTQFNKKWLDAVKKKAVKTPPEEKLVREIIEKYDLRYVEEIGFYEYRKGVWKKRSENTIRAYISDLLGFWATGSKVESIFRLLRARISTEDKFNMENIFNFANGVLKLNSGEFVAHDKKYLTSWQVGYSYTPDAVCPLWRKFVREIANDNVGRIALIQEMAGYCLFTDNRLQKAFFLIGDGANGKSVLLNILTQVFGEANVSNVEMSSLLEPFQRIQLMNSLVNIASETSSSVKGTEALFKQIVNGERINACYKNKDFVTFNPRCKMISAANYFIKSKDSSFGFLRRIQFIKFVRKFTGANADLSLTEKLLKELPGIFNWVYEGYLRLMKQKRFTEVEEETELMTEFMQITNPIYAFIAEELNDKTGTFSKQEMYTMYVNWCNSAGHEPQSRTRFIRSFKQAIEDDVFINETENSFVLTPKQS